MNDRNELESESKENKKDDWSTVKRVCNLKVFKGLYEDSTTKKIHQRADIFTE